MAINNMKKLPIVSKEIRGALFKDLSGSSSVIDSRIDELLQFWHGFEKEQPAISSFISEELRRIPTAVGKGAYIQGAWLVYKSLKVQLEVDELNEVWGDVEP
jgi:hypothetical protein